MYLVKQSWKFLSPPAPPYPIPKNIKKSYKASPFQSKINLVLYILDWHSTIKVTINYKKLDRNFSISVNKLNSYRTSCRNAWTCLSWHTMSQSSINTHIAHVRVCESILQLALWHFLLQLTCLSWRIMSQGFLRISHTCECAKINFANLTLADRWSAYRTSCCNELAYHGTQCVQASNCFW